MSKSENRQFTGSYQAVFGAICEAARAEGLEVRYADPSRGLIQLSSTVSMASWGETLQVTVQAPSAGVVGVTIGSSLKFGLVDWGKNQKNIDRLASRVEAVLSQPPAAAWHPDPKASHELRWWDGSAWTDQVSDGGQVNTDPL